MENVIVFQQTPENVMDSTPWPVVVAAIDGEVQLISGRPDAHLLVGFAEPGHPEISILASEAIENPQLVIGLTPVFVDIATSNFFSDVRPVTSARVWEGDEAGLEKLRQFEKNYQEAYLASLDRQ